MEEVVTDYEESSLTVSSNWTWDYLNDLDTSQYPFPNELWKIKPGLEIAIKTSSMAIVAVIGIFLNCVILIIIARNRWLWSASNLLVLNMAFIDMITLIFAPWFMLVRDFFQNYVLKNFGCRFEGYMQATLLLAGVGSVLSVSYDRMAAAALTADARITKKFAPKLIIIIWVLCLALSLPMTLKRTYTERVWLDYVEMYCVEDTGLTIYWHFIIALLVWIPLGAMTITYGIIMWRLERYVKRLVSRGAGHAVFKARGRAMRVTAMVLVMAIIGRVPYTVLIYWRNGLTNEVNAVSGNFENFWFAANYLMYSNSAVNPLIYGFTNIRFRKAMDRTPGVSYFRFGAWCCACNRIFKKPPQPVEDKMTEKIFVIENSPHHEKPLTRVIKNMLHINRDSLEVSLPKVDETTKPTKLIC